jgi:hypothetical protein
VFIVLSLSAMSLPPKAKAYPSDFCTPDILVSAKHTSCIALVLAAHKVSAIMGISRRETILPVPARAAVTFATVRIVSVESTAKLPFEIAPSSLFSLKFS